jgi:hypothetical protein
MTRSRLAIKRALAALLCAGIAFFFARALRDNWNAITRQHFELSPLLLLLALLTASLSCFLSTEAWRSTINALSPARKLSFAESVATINTTSLTKYLPGKGWSLALQMYWLVADGFSKSLVLYVNLVNLLVSALASSLVALLSLLFSEVRFPRSLVALAIGSLLLGAFAILRFHAIVLRRLARFLTKRFQREVPTFDLSAALLLKLHAIHLAAALTLAAATCVLCRGIGYRVAMGDVLLLTSATLLSDLAGLLAFLVPAGIGVRESVMYLVLGGKTRGPFALVLPLVSRLLYLATDFVVGLIALKLLRNLSKQRARSRPPPA